MYQVIKMYGDWEPWWFLDDWKESIQEVSSFNQFEEALDYYSMEWDKHKEAYPSYQSKQNLLAAFWDKEDQRWCEECDEHLQQYHSLLLLEDWQELSRQNGISSFESCNDESITPSSCALNR